MGGSYFWNQACEIIFTNKVIDEQDNNSTKIQDNH